MAPSRLVDDFSIPAPASYTTNRSQSLRTDLKFNFEILISLHP